MIKFRTTEKGSKKYEYKTHEWDLSNQLDVDKFIESNPIDFVKAGRVVRDTSRTCGFRIEMKSGWEHTRYVLYLMVVEGKILKGGKSKNRLPSRTYGAGTEANWTMKGSPSPTNYIYSQIFRACLEEGKEVEFYCYTCPSQKNVYEFAGNTIEIETSPYEEMESILNAMLAEQNNAKPIGEGGLLQQYKK